MFLLLEVEKPSAYDVEEQLFPVSLKLHFAHASSCLRIRTPPRERSEIALTNKACSFAAHQRDIEVCPDLMHIRTDEWRNNRPKEQTIPIPF